MKSTSETQRCYWQLNPQGFNYHQRKSVQLMEPLLNPSMQLTQMQDIAGVRAVLDSVSQVTELANDYRNNTAFDHRLRNVKDYISEPRDMDGYRSVHLIYEYKNNRNHAYDGLILEVQMRSKLQHIWATAVETMGTFLGQALKSRQGEKAWLGVGNRSWSLTEDARVFCRRE